jgi:hypothetical protein
MGSGARWGTGSLNHSPGECLPFRHNLDAKLSHTAATTVGLLKPATQPPMLNKLTKRLALLGGACFLAGSLIAQDSQAILDILVRKGVLTADEAKAVMAEADSKRRPPPVVVTPNRNTISQLRIRGRIQGQYAFADGSNSGTAAGAGDYSSFELRRARLGVQGRIFQDWNFMVEMNALSTVDLDGALLTYAKHPEANIAFGKGKPQFGHEENTSSASIITMERSLLTNYFQGGKPLGLRVNGTIAKTFSYHVGLFNGRSVSTSRMGSGTDSYLFNVSGGFNLDGMAGEGNQLRLRLDYLNSSKATGYYRFKDAFATSLHFKTGDFDVRTEYMWGEDHAGRDSRGFYVMPSYFFVPKKFEGVLRFESVKGDAGVNLGANRYAADIPGIYRSGNRYQGTYVGLNYYIYGEHLKLMTGLERGENKDGTAASNAKGRTTTLISGARMQF